MDHVFLPKGEMWSILIIAVQLFKCSGKILHDGHVRAVERARHGFKRRLFVEWWSAIWFHRMIHRMYVGEYVRTGWARKAACNNVESQSEVAASSAAAVWQSTAASSYWCSCRYVTDTARQWRRQTPIGARTHQKSEAQPRYIQCFTVSSRRWCERELGQGQEVRGLRSAVW